jgi:hypothetical protein
MSTLNHSTTTWGGSYAYPRPANFRPIYEKKMGVTPDPAQIRNLDFVRRGHRSQVGTN